jgi:hypothetical protein
MARSPALRVTRDAAGGPSVLAIEPLLDDDSARRPLREAALVLMGQIIQVVPGSGGDSCPYGPLRASGQIGRLCRLYRPFATPDRIGSVG